MLNLDELRVKSDKSVFLLKSIYQDHDSVSEVNVGYFETKEAAEALLEKLTTYKAETSKIKGYICYVDTDFDLSAVNPCVVYAKKDLTLLFVLNKDQDSLRDVHKSNQVSFFTYLTCETDKLKDFFADEFSTFSIEKINLTV